LNYKDLFHRVFQLISSPDRAWEEICLEGRQKVMVDFVYPLIALAGLSVFIGTLFEVGWGTPENYQVAMTECCAVAISLFGGFFLSSYLINLMDMKLFGMRDNMSLSQQFVGYSMVVILVLQIIYGIFPDFAILVVLLSFYTIYIVWIGSEKRMRMPEDKRLRFTIFSSIVILLCPVLIQMLFNQLTAMLN